MKKLLLTFFLLLISNSNYSHHATGSFFDMSKPVILSGVMVETRYINPHVKFLIETSDGEIWEIESAPVNRLQRLGYDGIAQVGDSVSFIGVSSSLGRNDFLAAAMRKDGSADMIIDPGFANQMRRRFDYQFNEEVEDRNYQNASNSYSESNTVDSIFRIWTAGGAMGMSSPSPLPYSALAIAAREAWDPIIDDPALDCIPPGMPVTVDTPFPMAFREEGENIIQQFEQWDAIRMFHMNGDLSDADSLEPSLQGYSVGRWEEDMLLVETTNISWPYFDEYGTPQTENMIIEEKFSFDQNNDTLKWEATINEPHAFDSPVTLARDYQWIPGEELKPYNCEFERD
ncbi:MAG: hypothetical protein CBC38_02750 [Gammaproteobacteria bacterium TMED78]|nr:MAG: hypothetical protein CBC38_02750 [Gammaproteobacteria bacterium TMED78]|tara:strand:+ start:80751 stop:81779 length:1029 start_codon:yes stop_codon:yes gene_type:complete